MLKDDFMLYRKSFSIDGLNLKFYIIKCTQLKTLLSCKQFICRHRSIPFGMSKIILLLVDGRLYCKEIGCLFYSIPFYCRTVAFHKGDCVEPRKMATTEEIK